MPLAMLEVVETSSPERQSGIISRYTIAPNIKDSSGQVEYLLGSTKTIGLTCYLPFRMPLRSGFSSSTGEVSGALTKQSLASWACATLTIVRKLWMARLISLSILCIYYIRIFNKFQTFSYIKII